MGLPLPGCRSGRPTANFIPGSSAVFFNWSTAVPSIQVVGDARRRTSPRVSLSLNDSLSNLIVSRRISGTQRSLCADRFRLWRDDGLLDYPKTGRNARNYSLHSVGKSIIKNSYIVEGQESLTPWIACSISNLHLPSRSLGSERCR